MDKRILLAERLSGKTYQEIATEHNVSRQRIQQILSPPPSVKKLVTDRAFGKCEDCGVLVGKSGHIHHCDTKTKDLIEDYNDLPNLQLLCPSCHMIAHANGDLWKCQKCGHTWIARLNRKPIVCPKCRKYTWNNKK